MVDECTSEEQVKDTVEWFKRRQEQLQREYLNQLEAEMYRIANLPFYKSWQAPQKASKLLGIGVYWRHDGTPKTKFGYYFWTFLSWFRFKWYAIRNRYDRWKYGSIK